MKTMVCFSGGLDSAALLMMMKEQGEVVAISFDYGQPHRIELEYAKRFCNERLIPHQIVPIPIGKSGLMDSGSDTPVVMCRNTIMLSIASSMAHQLGCDQVAFGPTAEDYELFPDCRQEFVNMISSVMEYQGGPKIIAPLLEMTKPDIVSKALEYGISLNTTWSCYTPTESGEPCGVCLACQVREKGVAHAV